MPLVLGGNQGHVQVSDVDDGVERRAVTGQRVDKSLHPTFDDGRAAGGRNRSNSELLRPTKQPVAAEAQHANATRVEQTADGRNVARIEAVVVECELGECRVKAWCTLRSIGCFRC